MRGLKSILKTEKKVRYGIVVARILRVIALVVIVITVSHIITCQRCSENGAECRKISMITYADRFRDQNGKNKSVHKFEHLQNGDILLTDCVHTFGWRHGHVAIVTDADEGIVLEAVTFGVPTKERSVKRWESYGRVLQLRIKDDVALQAVNAGGYSNEEGSLPSEIFGNAASDFAKNNIRELNYGFIPCLFKKSPMPEEMKKTHCAHLVWYIYSSLGIDIDSDGGIAVTPDDILNSDKLEIVETFGISST